MSIFPLALRLSAGVMLEPALRWIDAEVRSISSSSSSTAVKADDAMGFIGSCEPLGMTRIAVVDSMRTPFAIGG